MWEDVCGLSLLAGGCVGARPTPTNPARPITPSHCSYYPSSGRRAFPSLRSGSPGDTFLRLSHSTTRFIVAYARPRLLPTEKLEPNLGKVVEGSWARRAASTSRHVPEQKLEIYRETSFECRSTGNSVVAFTDVFRLPSLLTATNLTVQVASRITMLSVTLRHFVVIFLANLEGEHLSMARDVFRYKSPHVSGVSDFRV